ncbi:P2Y purinoceptor 8 [Bombina bombina]|uniref:P2Y purinoceptor 8 n=1 Tax=Bombina bombina TaxID=8345 RepID=UPI00235B11E5|nr:P2Y purinoceptor 8 [Bombina bombina]
MKTNYFELPNETKPDNETLEMLQNTVIPVVMPIMYSILAFISIPGNSISLWILIFHSRPITASIIFMINLSITDLVLAVFLPFQIIYHINKSHWPFGKGLCNVMSLLFYVNMYSSILTIMLISIDRYIGIVHPMQSSMWRRKRYAVTACIIMWTFLLLSFYPLASTDLTYKVDSLNITTCFDVLKWKMLPNLATWAAFIIGLVFVLFFIPSVVVVVCYTLIIRKLFQTSNRYGSSKRSIKLAFTVLLVFLTCFAPNNIVLLVHAINRIFYGISYYYAYKLTLTLSCLSSCLDPFLYYFASKDFYKKFTEVFGKKTKQSETCETRRGSLFSGKSMTFSSGHGEGLQNGSCQLIQRQESDV